MTKYPKPVVEGVARTVPLQRLGTEEEFAWLVAYLASPAGDYFSGAILTMDGARDNWFGPWPPVGLTDEERQAARRGAATEGVSEVPELRTERLLMRGWRFEDLRRRWAEILADPAVARWVGKPTGLPHDEAWRDMAVLSRALVAARLRPLGARGAGQRRSWAAPGCYYPPDWPALEVGWTVAPEHWGRATRPRPGAPRATGPTTSWAHGTSSA